MQAFHYSDAKGADFFNGHVERIYGLFATLTPVEVDQFKQWYQANNDIMLQPIHLVCVDHRTRNVYVLAEYGKILSLKLSQMERYSNESSEF